jgi:hypothetical protein
MLSVLFSYYYERLCAECHYDECRGTPKSITLKNNLNFVKLEI